MVLKNKKTRSVLAKQERNGVIFKEEVKVINLLKLYTLKVNNKRIRMKTPILIHLMMQIIKLKKIRKRRKSRNKR